jgi:hypothetical protein
MIGNYSPEAQRIVIEAFRVWAEGMFPEGGEHYGTGGSYCQDDMETAFAAGFSVGAAAEKLEVIKFTPKPEPVELTPTDPRIVWFTD